MDELYSAAGWNFLERAGLNFPETPIVSCGKKQPFKGIARTRGGAAPLSSTAPECIRREFYDTMPPMFC